MRLKFNDSQLESLCGEIRRDVFQSPKLSWEAKGYYGMLESDAINFEEIPENIQHELIEFLGGE